MTASGYEQDAYLKALTERLRKLELSVARNKPASGVTVDDPGGFFGGPGGLTVEQVFALIGAGTLPDSFLLKWGGGEGNVQELGNLGSSEVIDVQNANKFKGTLNANAVVSFVGWTSTKDAQILVVTTQDGTGGWSVTWSGVTFPDGITPTPDTAPGTRVLWAFLSDDGGTIIDGFMIGGSATTEGMVPHLIEAGETFTVPVKKQALWNEAITVDAGGSLVVDGYLLMVT